MTNKTALITGGSKGLGFSLAEFLAKEGWQLIINGRDADSLSQAKQHLLKFTETIAIQGDVQDEDHLQEFVEVLQDKNWRLDLVVNNASTLGISPLTVLLDFPVDNLHQVLHTNMIAPVSLLQRVRPYLNKGAKVINISSDAAREAYPTWGAYGGSKAGLDHMTAIMGKENPEYYFYAFDPGDMRTDMHQAAYPGEDISDRPFPEEIAVPALWSLINSDQPSGRYSVYSSEQQLV